MTAEVKVGDTECLILTGNKSLFYSSGVKCQLLWVGVSLGVCVVRQNTRISHAGRWRRKSELLVKQRQQLIKTLLHSQSVTSLVSPPLLREAQGLLVCLFGVFSPDRTTLLTDSPHC